MNDLNLDKSWRMGENSFSEIIRRLSLLHPETIVEFGSGASSIQLAREFKHAKIIAIEHDKDFFDEANSLKNKYHVGNLEIYYCPLQWHIFKLCLYQSYSNGYCPQKIDAVIIDGPPYYVHKGREYCLHSVNNKLKTGGLIILDDYKRHEEKKCVQNWKLTYPSTFQETILETDNHLCLLKVQKELKAHISINVIIDNYSSYFSIITGKIKTCIRKYLVNDVS